MEQSKPRDAFEYEDWVDSVAGRTLRVTAWNEAAAERVAPTGRETYCGECDEDVMLVVDAVVGEGTVGHCPMCGSLPGLHETADESGRRVADGT